MIKTEQVQVLESLTTQSKVAAQEWLCTTLYTSVIFNFLGGSSLQTPSRRIAWNCEALKYEDLKLQGYNVIIKVDCRSCASSTCLESQIESMMDSMAINVLSH